HRGHRALPVRSRDMDRLERTIRSAEPLDEGRDVVESELDPELLETKKIGQRLVQACSVEKPGGTAAAMAAPAAAGSAAMNRRARAMVAFSSRRSTTRSSIPLSRRNSLR